MHLLLQFWSSHRINQGILRHPSHGWAVVYTFALFRLRAAQAHFGVHQAGSVFANAGADLCTSGTSRTVNKPITLRGAMRQVVILPASSNEVRGRHRLANCSIMDFVFYHLMLRSKAIAIFQIITLAVLRCCGAAMYL